MQDVVRRFQAALPSVQLWIEELLGNHTEHARSISTQGFSRLSTCFPTELLERSKVVTVPHVPYPPVDQFGLPELAVFQQMEFSGITFKDTILLQRGHDSESLYFHEMVHVVQWARLGVENFLLAYGIGLMQCGYEQSPLELMAYSLQTAFEEDSLPSDLVSVIEERTDAVWSQVGRLSHS